MKRYWCPKCKELKITYNHYKTNKGIQKPFLCHNCNERFTYKQTGAIKKYNSGYNPKDPEKVKKLSKLLFKHCAKIMSEKRKLFEV